MELTLNRQPSWQSTTLGQLSEDGVFLCYTLEDQVRHAAKVFGETAIPAGRYRVVVTWSPKFQRDMPLLVDVPGFEGVRIHTGNDADETLGCILVGQAVSDAQHIIRSKAAFDALFPKIVAGAASPEGCWIDIRDGDAA